MPAVPQPYVDTDLMVANARGNYLKNYLWTHGLANFARDDAPMPAKEDYFQGPEWSGSQQEYDLYRSSPLALVGALGGQSPTGYIFGLPDTKYRIMAGGKAIANASTPEEALQLAQYANKLIDEGKGKAVFDIQQQRGDGDWRDVYVKRPDFGLGDIIKTVAPAMLNLIPGIGQALSFGVQGLGGTMLGAGLTGALGATGAGLAAGDPLGQALKAGLTTGGISALTAGLLRGTGLDSALKGSPGAPGAVGAPTNVVGGLGAPSLSLPGEIVVNASRIAAPSLGGLAGSIAGGAFNPASIPQFQSPNIGQQPSTPASPDEIVVTGSRPGVLSNIGAKLAGVGGLGGLAALLSGGSGAAAPAAAVPSAAGQETAATTSQQTGAAGGSTAGGTAATGGALGPIGKVLTGLSVLDALSGAFGGGGGAGQGGTASGAIGTPSSLSSIFRAQLPATGGLGALGTPRDMSGVDFSRYGYGPAKSFFTNVPTGPQDYAARPAPAAGYVPPGNAIMDYIRRMAPGVSDAQIGQFLAGPGAQALFPQNATGYAEGGRAVYGPGSGRDDDIPARLSDGEYVIDAETVALLGDGSSKEGAKRLDQFRVNVRKHKGQALAKGRFSDNAKPPETYLSGGRV